LICRLYHTAQELHVVGEALTSKDLVEQRHAVEEEVYTQDQREDSLELEMDRVNDDVYVVFDHQDVLLK